MDIAAMSMSLSQFKTQQSVGIAMASKVMDLQETQGAMLVEDLRNAVPPTAHLLDTRA